jgi:phage terminase large subunit-like protein
MDVYNECLIRTATLNGITMLTFTPLMGLSEVVLSFLPADQQPGLGG